jgi:ATP-dependent Clp protease protease subunit
MKPEKKTTEDSKAKSGNPGVTGVGDSNQIWVHEFDEAAAQSFCSAVLAKTEEDEDSPIAVYIDSYGGYVDGLNAMLGVLDSVPNPIITIATGKAMSAGATLLSHGDHRCVGPHARVMIHEMSAGAWGNVNDIKVEAAEIEIMNNRLMEVLANNCGKSVKVLKAMLRGPARELYLSPVQAVKFGIVDHIGIPQIKIHQAFELKFLAKKRGRR